MSLSLFSARLFTERTRDLARRRHRSVGVLAFGLFLRNGSAARFVRGLIPGPIIEARLANPTRGVFCWRGIGRQRWVLAPVALFLISRQPIAYTRFLHETPGFCGPLGTGFALLADRVLEPCSVCTKQETDHSRAQCVPHMDGATGPPPSTEKWRSQCSKVDAHKW